jgi:hypothetical protein
MRHSSSILLVLLLAALLLSVFGCGAPSRIETVQTRQIAARLALSRSEMAEERRTIASGSRDTIRVTDPEGRELILMKAVRDEGTGEMVASEVIDAAVITARFRNVAERHGRIDLRFEVIVPGEMLDSRWQLRFYPDMFVLEDSIRLEPVIITGSDYRKAQLRGYELYEKYLRSIITDSAAFVDWRNLEIWISRNLPELYRFKEDTTFVAEETFHSLFGPTEADAIRHYTRERMKRWHDRRWNLRDEKFHELVKVPIETEGVRLDTVLRDIEGNFVYQYTQSLRTRPRLRKVDIVLSGDIWESDVRLYEMPRTAPLTFYISSLSSFVDGTERYLTRIVERRAAAHTACYVDFAQGSAAVDLDLGHNREEMGRIRGNILELLGNTTYEMDSIVIAASASPEGTVRQNDRLALDRAAAVASHFDAFVRDWRDSVRRSSFSLVVGEDGKERRGGDGIPDIRFVSRSRGENWPYLAVLVDEDTLMSAGDKRSFVRLLGTADPDEREHALQGEPYYRHLREDLYPRLRTVRFDFHLHRKGMVKDTVHTTELDTTYMRGVWYLREREYEKALSCLREYRDYNTAIAYVSLDYNASAMAILQELERTPQVNYMLALLYARSGDEQKAVQCYLEACREERSLVFRGNLDPEIYVLIQRYGLNKEDEGYSEITS